MGAGRGYLTAFSAKAKKGSLNFFWLKKFNDPFFPFSKWGVIAINLEML